MRQRSLDEMITYFNQEIDKMDIDRRYKIALLGMVTAIGCTAKQTIEERKKGKWVVKEINTFDLVYGSTVYEPVYECSECGRVTESYLRFDEPIMPEDADFPRYCPNCGADMRGGEE